MANEQEFIDAISEVNAGGKMISFAELIVKVWGGKVVEVYIGDTFEDLKRDESTTKVAAVVIGKVVAAYRECLVMNCAYVDQRTGKAQFGNVVCLNERGIRTITEIDESGMLKDTFLSSLDGCVVKKLLHEDR